MFVKEIVEEFEKIKEAHVDVLRERVRSYLERIPKEACEYDREIKNWDNEGDEKTPYEDLPKRKVFGGNDLVEE